MKLLDQRLQAFTVSITVAKSFSIEFLDPFRSQGKSLPKQFASLWPWPGELGPVGGIRGALAGVLSSFTASQPKERPRSAVLLADETVVAPIFANRRSQQSVSLSKSVSIQNIAG